MANIYQQLTNSNKAIKEKIASRLFDCTKKR